MNNSDYLKKLAFFSELPEDYLERISEISIQRSYKRNMIIFMEDEPGEAFFYIKSGKVKIYRTYDDGREHIIHILGPQEVFGEVTLFNNINYPASASVYEDAEVIIFKNNKIEELIRQNSDLAFNMIKILSRKLLFAQQKIKDLTFNDVYSRMASQIIKLSMSYGKKTDKGILIDINLSRQELADMTGTTRETVSRVISRFKKEKSISEEKDSIIIIDEQKLKNWI
ncbi:MAG: Crp/Fnr family transcriptional regulator [Clostridiaceae bacterium]|nr:Crp/Fnr family transcriptional regulator [Clostridiaceae bacterium]